MYDETRKLLDLEPLEMPSFSDEELMQAINVGIPKELLRILNPYEIRESHIDILIESGKQTNISMDARESIDAAISVLENLEEDVQTLLDNACEKLKRMKLHG